MDDAVGPAGNTVGRNGMIAADYYMQRLGIVFPLDSNPGSSLQRVHCAAIEYNKGYIDYARPWEPMDLDAGDVVGALQERLLWYYVLVFGEMI